MDIIIDMKCVFSMNNYSERVLPNTEFNGLGDP